MDDEALDLRRLPAPEPLARARYPRRLSQTLLGHTNSCPRSAYLYLKWSGGAASHPLDRGTATHIVAEKLILGLIRQGADSYFAPELGEDPEDARAQVASMTEALVEEVRREYPDLVIPASEWDAVRVMAYHIALGLDVKPTDVAGVERKFVLDLPESGWTVSGKIDLLSLPHRVGAQIDDYKSSIHVPTEQEFEEESGSFQTKLYACLVAFGQPVEKGPDGREVRLPAIGGHLSWVRGRQLYPRPGLRQDGTLQRREATWSRTDLRDFMVDLEAIARRVQRGLEENDWPARYSSHCTMCPSEPECPLPAFLRRYHGAIQSREQAEEALAWAERMGGRVADTRREIRAFAKKLPSGLVRAGDGDVAYRLVVRNGRKLRQKGKVSDWDGLEAAIVGAVEHGHPFDLREWVKLTATTEFKKERVTDELRAAFEGGSGSASSGEASKSEQDLDERWGANAPF